MNGFLIDTNVISELLRARIDPNVREWTHANDETLMFLSVLTLGEIRKGITKLSDPPKRGRLEAWLQHDLQIRFAGRILPIDADIADRWGRISGVAAARGTPLPVVDGLLAATALEHDLVFVTRDASGVEGSGVTVLNPWI